MSLRSPLVYLIPEDTAAAARAAFPKGNPYLLLAEELGALYANAHFAALFAATGQPALDPARLAAVTANPRALPLTLAAACPVSQRVVLQPEIVRCNIAPKNRDKRRSIGRGHRGHSRGQ